MERVQSMNCSVQVASTPRLRRISGPSNRKNMKLLFVAGFLIFSTCALARIGETLDECKSRYGSPSGNLAADQITFKSGHVSIVVHVRNGRSIQEDFAPESGTTLSDSEVSEILQENSGGSTWEVSGETATVISYSRKDGNATAQRGKANANDPTYNIKLSMQGAELVIKLTAEAASKLPPAS